MPEANEGAIGFFYSTYISYLSNTDISVEQIREIITEYHLNSTNIDYLALTNAYLNINEVDLALATIQLGNNYRSGENRLKYYALLSEIYERNGHHKEALEAYKQSRERLVDRAENTLVRALEGFKGDPKSAIDAAKFILQYMGGAERGYSTKQQVEISGKDGSPLTPPVIIFEPAKHDMQEK